MSQQGYSAKVKELAAKDPQSKEKATSVLSSDFYMPAMARMKEHTHICVHIVNQ